MRERGLADDRQEKVERTNKLRATDLEDRELDQKEKLMARREARQEAADDDAEATEPDAVLDFASFGQEVTLLDVEKLPSAFMREDNETLLYEGVANTIFGEPSSAKSWIGLMAVIQQLRAGRRVIWWDNEDRATTLARRLQLLRATELIGHRVFGISHRRYAPKRNRDG